MRAPLAPATVSAAVVRVLADAIAHATPDGDRELERIGIPRDLASDAALRLPEPLVAALFERGPIVTRDDAFGAHAGERSARGTYGFVEYFVASSGTLREALVRFADHYRLLSEAGTVELVATGDGARITFSRYDRTPLRHEAEFFVSAVLAVARRAVSRARCHAGVSFMHARPADTRAHARVFGGGIAFGASCTTITFDAVSLAVPLVTADEALGALLRPIVIAAEREVAPADVVVRARSSLRRALAEGDGTIRSVARGIAMSPRSLQRALAERETTFAALLDDVRRELAFELLADRRLELAEIAARVGFSRPSAFHRAFRRWTDATPNAYRAHRSCG